MNADRMAKVGKLAWLPAGRKSKWAVLVFWLIVAAFAAGPSGLLMGAEKNDAIAWLPGSAESTKVIQAAQQFQSKDEIPTIVVYERAAGLTPQDMASVTAQVAKFNAVQAVDRDSVGPIPSQDKKALQVAVPINAGSAGWDKLAAAVDDMRSIAKASPAGLSVHFTGPGGFAADSSAAFSGIDGKLLYSALAVVIFILLITYRSPVLWLLPVVSAGLALTVAEAVIYQLTKGGLTVNAQSAGILTVLVFGAGTDYALLLVARYREELRRHEDRHEAMAFALHRAGPAIFASGPTVIAGMLCLLVASMNSTKGLGPVAAVGIAVGLMVMLTLLPALLVIFGRWFFWPVRPTFGSADHTQTGFWAKVRQAHRPGPTGHVGRHVRRPGRRGAGHLPAQRGRAPEQGCVLRHAGLGCRRAGSGQALPGRLRAAGRGPCKGRSCGGGDLGDGRRPGDLGGCPTGGQGRSRLPGGHALRRPRQPGRDRHGRPCATRSTRSRALRQLPVATAPPVVTS